MSTAKRILTDEKRESTLGYDASTHSSTPPDLVAQLRNVGLRARKSVTEGYRTSSTSFNTTRSENHIFRSASDTLRDVYASPLTRENTNVVFEKKRTREEGYESEKDAGDTDVDDDAIVDNRVKEEVAARLNRPVKPLRKPRRQLTATQSMPAAPFMLTGNSKRVQETTEEADWSEMTISSDFSSKEPFEPMDLS